MEWTLSSFHFSLCKKIMESEKNCWVVAVQLLVLFSSCCQWVAAFHVGLHQRGGGSSDPGDGKISGYTLPKPLTHHDLTKHYIPHNDFHLEKEIDTKNEINDKKKTGGDIDIFTKRVLESIAKRVFYANSEEEVNRWQAQENEDDLIKLRAGVGLKKKRSELQEYHAGGCVAKINWILYDDNHFPRMLKSYNCTSPTCNLNYGECHPKTFIIKVLKRNEGQVAEEHCDSLLPEELRCNWKLEAKNVTTYCECRSNQPLTLYGR